MALLDRFVRRRAGTELATARPDASAVPIGDEAGTFGGPNALAGYTSRRSAYLTPFLTETKLRPNIIKEMRRHHQVGACLMVQSLPIIGADWDIECQDEDVRDLVKSALAPIMTELMRSATRALWAGYSPNTIVWDVDPETGAVVPAKIRDLDPFTCKPVTDAAGNYAGFVQNEGMANEANLSGVVDGVDMRLLTMWLVEGMESGNLYGRSILTGAMPPWQRQLAHSLFHDRYLERFGEPIAVGRAPDGIVQSNLVEYQEAIAAGQTPPAPVYERPVDMMQGILDGMRNHTTISLPGKMQQSADGAKVLGYEWDISYLESKGGAGADFRDSITLQDKHIARAIFVPDLLMGDGGGIGSYALGAEHRDVWTLGVENRLEDWAAQITRHLVRRIVEFNFGERAPQARLAFAPMAEENKTALWGLVTSLVETGRLPVDAVEIANRVGVPIDAEAVEAAAVAPVVVAPPAPVGEQRHTHGDLAAAPADVTGIPEWQQPQAVDPQPWRRDPNAREKRVNFRALEDGMNSAERAAIDAMAELLDGSHGRVLRQVEGILRKGGTPADVVAALSTVNVATPEAFASTWVSLMRDVWGLGLGSARAEVGSFGERIPEAIGRDGLAVVKAYAAASADRLVSDLTTRVRLAMIDTYTSGVTTKAGLTAAVSDLYDKLATSEGQAPRRTTRTLSTRALNQGRADAIVRGGVPLRGAQFSALMDRRTCELCTRQDEQVVPIGDLDYAKFTPPLHYGCRCVWVFITQEEADFTPTWSAPPRSLVESFGSLVVS